ncbi:acetyl-CoA C-acetyltransferase [Mariniblastus fucicola]|uniref:Acetyl-CoA acetyltransferase n=1 Tax=Mariniblastus fucicola TaxID=980251 RepID=A0A5B9P7R2_9BACT|nr:acetyl-CoA C-acetyltransferase [Mariniblastus fucicola]QEG21235.1 Acetyl-CoA acetyltransferase [Mariniblastus fucicola]
MASSYLISGARTPIGSFLGGLSSLPAPQLGGIAIESAMSKAQISADSVDEVIMGNVIGAGVGQAPARQAALAAGLPNSIAALTVNKVCGSGLKAVMLADQAIRCGDASVIVAGGMENMSAAPHLVKNLRGGLKLGDGALVDAMVYDGLTCSFENCHMGMHAEHIAKKFDVTREQQDELSATSQQRASAAIEAGFFDNEIVPVTIKHRKGDKVVDRDECVRADSTAEGLSKLRPVFDREGSVTAGNASTLSDGAAAVVVVSEEAAASATSKFRIVANYTSGTEPKDLFIAPVEAIRGALKKADMSLDQVDLFEINEAFASQMLACVKELQLDMNNVNIWGGGISLGHPIGASGARVLVTLMSALRQTEKKIGVASLCLGGGNAVAMVIERC